MHSVSELPQGASEKITIETAFDNVAPGATSKSSSPEFAKIKDAIERTHKISSIPDDYSIGDIAPILNLVTSSGEDLRMLSNLFTTELSESATNNKVIQNLSKFIPTTTVQAPPTQKLAKEACVSCSYMHSQNFMVCYWCSRHFCKSCPIDYHLFPRIGSTSHLLCSQCIEDLTRADAEDWAEASLKHLEIVDDSSVIASLGSAFVAIALGKNSHDLFRSIARKLHHQKEHDIAYAVITSAVQSRDLESSKQLVKRQYLVFSILKALASCQTKTWDERWCFALASKEAYLHAHATSQFEHGTEIVESRSRRQEIDALSEQLLEEGKTRHQHKINKYRLDLELFWLQRKLPELLDYWKTITMPFSIMDTVIGEEASMKAFQMLIDSKKFLELFMSSDDHHAILFLKGMLELKEGKFVSALTNLETAAWSDSSTVSGDFIFAACFHLMRNFYSYSALRNVLQSGSVELLFSSTRTATPGMQDQSLNLLFPSNSELTPPFKKNWPCLSVVGLNSPACHQKNEETIMNLYSESKLTDLEVAWAYIDMISECKHSAELTVCYLHAAMWLVKQFNGDLNHHPSSLFAFKCVVMELVRIAYSIAFKRLNPGMELYTIRLVVGLMRKMAQMQESKLFLTSEDAELLEILLKRLIKVSMLFPFWTPPSVSVGEAVLLNNTTANLHGDFLLGLQLVDPEERPLSNLDLTYQLYENDLRGIMPLQNSSDSCAKAMENLLQSQGWSWKDVIQLMSSHLIERDQHGWIKQSPALSTPQEYSQVTGFIFDTNPLHPTLELLVVKTNMQKGKIGLFSKIDINTVLQLEESDFPLFFSLDPPSHDLDKQFHPFQQWRYKPKKIKDTEVLKTMFITDYLMKSFTIGSEVSSLPPFEQRPCKDGLTKNLPPKLQEAIRSIDERGGTHSQDTHRFWIEAKAMEYECQQDGSKIEFHFGEMEMIVKSHRLFRHADGEMTDTDEEDDPDSPHAMFAKDMTDHYAELSQYFPVFARLRELSKLHAFSQLFSRVIEKLKAAAEGTNFEHHRRIFEACFDFANRFKSKTPHALTSCNWVPAAISHRSGSISYGGVAFVTELFQVSEGSISMPKEVIVVPVTIPVSQEATGTSKKSQVHYSNSYSDTVSKGVKDSSMLTHLSSAIEVVSDLMAKKPTHFDLHAQVQPSNLTIVNHICKYTCGSSQGNRQDGERLQGNAAKGVHYAGATSSGGGGGRSNGGKNGSGITGGNGGSNDGDDDNSLVKIYKMWESIKKRSLKKAKHNGTIYYMIEDDQNEGKYIWVSRDTARHAGAAFKVYADKGTKLDFRSSYNADFKEMHGKNESNEGNRINKSKMHFLN